MRSRIGRFRWLVVCGVLAVWGATPAAGATVALGPSLVRPLVDDASGRVVWQPNSSTLLVREAGQDVRARPVGVGADCRVFHAPLSGDLIGLDCESGARTINLLSGAVLPIPGSAMTPRTISC
jgi:hypothetical protein